MQGALRSRFVKGHNGVAHGLLRGVEVAFFDISSRRLYKRSGSRSQRVVPLIAALGYSI